MADPPRCPHRSSAEHDDHHARLFKIYMIVAAVLAVCTGSSFASTSWSATSRSAWSMGFVLILGVAVVKAFLVGFYFMHLKWDWRLLYFIIVPVFILGAMMVIILMPDMVVGPSRDANEASVIAAETP